MPTWLRRFHIGKINDFVEKQNEEQRKSQGNEQMGDDNKVHRPNINPNNVYNF